MDYAQENYKAYIGRHISEHPTPALVVSLPLIKRNIQALHEDVEKLGIGFRPHIKTLKSLELTRMMLAGGKYRSIVASTLCEIHGALPLVKEGVLDECIYGLPVYPGIIPRLAELRASIRILLMVDCEQQITALEKAGFDNPWDVFIKLDVGTHRAGVMYNSSSLNRLVKRAEASSAVRIHGFYCHAGHSYGGRSRSQAEDALGLELSSALDAAKLLPDDRELIVSIGSTPTAHVVQSLKALAPANVKLELHAGNFPCNDLQQVSTGLVSETDQAVRLAAEVCSIYPDRNEALINAGVIALSRETSAYPGFGKVVEHPSWSVVRLSQEHGILGIPEGKGGVTESVEDVLEVGKKITLYVNHTCMTAAAAHVYFVVDENDVVREGWVPWKGW